MKTSRLSTVRARVVVAPCRDKYCLSDDTALDLHGLRNLYRIHRHIEEVYRCLKQELGRGSKRHSTLRPLQARLALTLAAFTLIDPFRQQPKLRSYKYGRGVISGRIPPPSIVPHPVSITA